MTYDSTEMADWCKCVLEFLCNICVYLCTSTFGSVFRRKTIFFLKEFRTMQLAPTLCQSLSIPVISMQCIIHGCKEEFPVLDIAQNILIQYIKINTPQKNPLAGTSTVKSYRINLWVKLKKTFIFEINFS